MKHKIIGIVAGALLLSGIAFGENPWNECGEKRVECGEVRVEKCESRNGFYLGASGSLVFGATDKLDAYGNGAKVLSSKLNLKTGHGWSIAMGGAINGFRIELEGISRKAKLKKYQMNILKTGFKFDHLSKLGDARTLALMLNLCYDIPFENDFGMYVGAGGGIGLTLGKIETEAADGSKIDKLLTGSAGWAYQLMSGLTYDLTDHATAFLGYRFFAYKASGSGNGAIDKLKLQFLSHSIDVGIRYRF